jgi:hypothetical protein
MFRELHSQFVKITHHVSCSLARKRLPSVLPLPSGHSHHLVALDHSCTRRQTRKRISRMQYRQSFTRRLAIPAKPYQVGHAHVAIITLPDEALLEIFHFYVDDNDSIEAWHPLVHVCRKWRNIVFGSPRRLNLHLHCTAASPVKEMLHIWPSLPIIINGSNCPPSGVDNIVAALKCNGRVRDVTFGHDSSSQCETVLAAMRVPFPELTSFHFESKDKTVPVVPDSFLGGSAPRLRSLSLDGILFSGLSRLLLSTTDLVNLSLSNIPHSGYMTPQAMATCLSTLTRLRSLSLNFQSPRSRPDPGRRCYPPASRRSVLTALTELHFTGVSEYLEDLVARIDAPLLHVLDIRFFFQLIFDTPQLAQFIDRTPMLNARDEAQVVFSDSGATVSLPQTIGDRRLELGISCQRIDWQLSSLAQVCESCFPRALISAVEHLHILEKRFSPHHWQDDVESNQWLELFLPFTTVRNLYLSKGFAPRVMVALQEFVGGGEMGVLPALQYLHLEVPPISTSPADHRGVRSCAAARQRPEDRSSMGQSTADSWWEAVDMSIFIRIPIVRLSPDILFDTHRLARPSIGLRISVMM